MSDTTSANYGFTKPEVGASSGTWGTKLNADIDSLDTKIKEVSDVASAALPKAGGTMTGELYLNGYGAHANVVALGAVSGATALNLTSGRNFTLTPTSATLSISNAPAGAFGIVLKITAGNGGVTWPASVKWAAGTAPTLTAGTDYIGLISLDGGTSYIGVVLGLAAA